MVEQIFATLSKEYETQQLQSPLCFYFSLGEVKRTVWLTDKECRVEEGKTSDNADCVCKTSEEMFARIWQEGYRPGLQDFLSGAIKSNKPDELKTFLRVFGKQP